MHLMADECINRRIVDRLRGEGHDVLYVAELTPSISDEMVLERANHENSLLLTSDKDFGELVFRQNRISTGVILVRLAGLSPNEKAKIVSSVIRKYSKELYRSFTVVSPGIIRIRKKI